MMAFDRVEVLGPSDILALAEHGCDRFGLLRQQTCEIGIDGCHVWQERRWVPLSRDGQRIYVHEELWMDRDAWGPAGLVLESQRPNFYDVEAPPLP